MTGVLPSEMQLTHASSLDHIPCPQHSVSKTDMGGVGSLLLPILGRYVEAGCLSVFGFYTLVIVLLIHTNLFLSWAELDWMVVTRIYKV